MLTNVFLQWHLAIHYNARFTRPPRDIQRILNILPLSSSGSRFMFYNRFSFYPTYVHIFPFSFSLGNVLHALLSEYEIFCKFISFFPRIFCLCRSVFFVSDMAQMEMLKVETVKREKRSFTFKIATWRWYITTFFIWELLSLLLRNADVWHRACINFWHFFNVY